TTAMSHKPAPLVSENAVRAAPGLANREMTVYTSRKPATVPTSHRVGLLMLFYLTPRGPSNALSASATDDCSEASPHELLSPSLSRKYVSQPDPSGNLLDRKSTRLNSSHVAISYAVFCLKKKKTYKKIPF